jgi:hypothetical protein
MNLTEEHYVREYVEPRFRKHSGLKRAQNKVLDAIPDSMPEDERTVLRVTVMEAENTRRVMRLALRAFGKKHFDRLFPP